MQIQSSSGRVGNNKKLTVKRGFLSLAAQNGLCSLNCRLVLSRAMLLLLFLALPFFGCAKAPDDSLSGTSLSGDLRTPIQINTENFVRRQPPAVYVRPVAPLGHRPKALFVPLRMTQQINNAVTFSDLASRQVWQIWLSQGGFSGLEYLPQAGPFELGRALALARMEGAELLIGGYINHYMDGGAGGESSVSLNIEIYDVKSGNLIWSMAQGGLMEAQKKHDFYLFEIRERNPADPSGLIIRSLAWDMGRIVLEWIDPFAVKPGQTSIINRVIGRTAF